MERCRTFRLARAGVCVLTALLPPGMSRAQTPAAAASGEVLLERTVAVVDGAVVTQSDVDLAVTLGLVEPATDGGTMGAAGAVINRWLMLREVARFSPGEPDEVALLARVAAVRARVGGEQALSAALGRAGFSQARLTAWLRDDLRIAAYLDQRFASAGAPADRDVISYVEQHRAALEASGVAPAELMRVASERLVAERRRDLISDWLSELRRRTDVVEFARRPG